MYSGYRNNLDDTDYETPEFSRTETVITRKPHICVWCNNTIPTGTRCEYTVCKMPDETVYSSYRHFIDWNTGECIK